MSLPNDIKNIIINMINNIKKYEEYQKKLNEKKKNNNLYIKIKILKICILLIYQNHFSNIENITDTFLYYFIFLCLGIFIKKIFIYLFSLYKNF